MLFQQFIKENSKSKKFTEGSYQEQLKTFQDRYKSLQGINWDIKGIELGFKNKLTSTKIFNSEKQIVLACNSFSQYSYVYYLIDKPPYFSPEKIILNPEQKFTANFDIDLKFNKFQFAENIIVACSDGKCRMWNLQNIKQKNQDINITDDQIKLNEFILNYDGIISTGKQPSFFITDINKQQNIIENYQHSNMITTMSQHNEGSLVYFGEDSGYGIVWDLRILEPVTDFNTNFEDERKFFEVKDYEFTNIKYIHDDRINDSNFDRSGLLLTTCSNDKMVKVWDLRKQKLIQTIPAHNSMIIQSKFLNNQNFLMTADIEGKIKIWDCCNIFRQEN